MSRIRLLLALTSTAFFACHHDAGGTALPWDDGSTEVVRRDASRTDTTPTVADPSCVPLTGACDQPVSSPCGDQAADLLLNSRGEVGDYICYPDARTWTVDDLRAHDGDIAQRNNRAVLVFDDAPGEPALVADVHVDANDVVLYGHSPSTAVIAGSLDIDGNNTLVRGLRIRGDVTIEKNDVTLANCVIEGNLVVNGNNARVLASDVLGRVTVSGHGTALHSLRVVGDVVASGKQLDCQDSFRAVDANGDASLSDAEVGGALACD